MEKHGTPERMGTCDDCSDNDTKVVVKVGSKDLCLDEHLDTDSEKVAQQFDLPKDIKP